MSHLLPLERLLINLEEDVPPEYIFIHVPKATVVQQLREATRQDFWYDAKKWREWLEKNGDVQKRQQPKCTCSIFFLQSRNIFHSLSSKR